jgi:hypothetical protein
MSYVRRLIRVASAQTIIAVPVTSSLVVRNHGTFDVNIYTIASTGSVPVRLGTVVGLSNSSFPLHTHDLAPDGRLVIRIRAIGSNSSWTSQAVTVSDDMIAVLDVSTDPFGDCSSSNLHTIVVADSTPRVAH